MTERKTETQLREIMIKAVGQVQLGGLYRHKKNGTIYVARDVTLSEDDLSPRVTYGSVHDRMVRFSRPMEEFLAKTESLPPVFPRSAK